jgi:hypothetical protein
LALKALKTSMFPMSRVHAGTSAERAAEPVMKMVFEVSSVMDGP